MEGSAPILLLIDDDESNRYTVGRILRGAGYTVLEASDGAAGLKHLNDSAIDAVICDIRLPDTTGYEILKHIKTSPQLVHIPVLLVSAYFRESELQGTEIHEAQADAYLPTPVEGPLIVASVRSLLRAARAERALKASEDRLRTLVSATFEGVIVTQNGRIVDVNDQAAAIFGYAPGEMLGLGVSDLVAPEHARRVLENIRQNRNADQEHIAVRKDGARILLETHGRTIPRGSRQLRITTIRDITERKRAEQALMESRERLRLAATSARLFAFEWDPVIDHVRREGDAAGVLGVDFQEETGASFFSRVHPEDRARFVELVKSMRPGADSYRTTYRVLRPDGEEAVLEESGRAFFDESGKFIRLIGMTADVTERTRAEHAIASQQRLLSGIIENIPVLLCIWDPQLKRFQFNRHLREVLGWSNEDTGADFMTRVYPDPAYRQRVIEYMQSLEGGWRDLKSTAKDGSQIDISWANIKLPDGRSIGIGVDVRERKAAEDALRRSESRLRTFFESDMVGAIYWDMDGRILDANKKFLEMVGYTREELVSGKVRWDEMTPPGYGEMDQAAIEDLRKTGVDTPYEKEYIRKDGTRIPIIIGAAMLDEKRHEGVAFVLDISTRKRAEAAARSARELLETVIKQMPAALNVIRGSDLRIQLVNPAYQAIAPEKQMVGRTLEEVWPETGLDFVKLCRHVLETGEAYEAIDHRVTIARAAGGPPEEAYFTWALHRVKLPGDEGWAILNTAWETTARMRAEASLRESESRLRLATEGARIGIWSADIATGRRECTPLTSALWGFPPDMPMRPEEEWFARIPADERQGVVDSYRACMAEGRHFWVEHRVIWPDGSVHWLETRGRPEKDSEGRPVRFIGITMDITERKHMEEDLKAAMVSAERAKAIAESASRAKDQFIAVLSHELRTPLTPAVAALSLLRRDVRLPSDVRDDLEMVSRNIELEVRLIADLLDVSRIISGKLHMEKRRVDVAETIREAGKIVSGDLDAKGQTLVIETPGSPYLAHADAARLQQVFWNLLRNSIKFSPARSKIIIRAHVEPFEYCPLAAQPCPVGMGDCPLPQAITIKESVCNGNLVVEVIDKGSGIAPEMLPRLFNAFEQEEKSRSFGGLGLGLSICRAVVEMHGGTISAHSEGIGCGATFVIRLPIAQCPLVKDVGQQMGGCAGQAGAADHAAHRAVRVVLVEDHADTARLMYRLLTSAGHEVVITGSVAEGLAEIRKTEPDILISDLGLPDGSGLDLMRQLLAEGRHIPSIALSGYGTPADVAKSISAGFSEHLVKPLSSLDVLTAAIQRARSHMR